MLTALSNTTITSIDCVIQPFYKNEQAFVNRILTKRLVFFRANKKASIHSDSNTWNTDNQKGAAPTASSRLLSVFLNASFLSTHIFYTH